MEVADALAAGARRLLTADEFVARWPALAPDRWAYEEIHAGVPKEWRAALHAAAAGDERDREVWHANDDGVWRRWTTPPTDERPAMRMVQRYEREEGGVRLAPRGAAEAAYGW